MKKETYPIKKYCEYYYQVKKKEGGYGWAIYSKYKKGRETLEENEEDTETATAAEGEVRDAISYYYL
jgi:hypothetical protein